MGRSRLPLIALLGAVGCTKQDAVDPHDTAPADDASPWRQKGGRLDAGDESGKGSSIRALTPEERANLIPRPVPEPESAAAQTAQTAPTTETAPTAETTPAAEPSGAGTSPDYSEKRRRRFNQRYHGKGSGIQRTEIRFIRGTDGGTPSPAKRN